MNVVDKGPTEEYLHCDLAPSFGKLNNEALQKMDDSLKVMIAGTTKLISQLKTRDWNDVLACVMQNPLVEPDGAELSRSEKYVKQSSEFFPQNEGPRQGVIREVNNWFVSLIGDEDVLLSTKIDINILAQIVAETGATIDSFETLFAKNEYHEKTMIDIGVLRYPDYDHPYFKLTAFRDSRRILMHQTDDNGITGEYNVRKFKPRDSVIKEMTAEARGKAVKMAEALF
nr:hypothetical protein CFP56_32334 [Quercus suber]